MGGKNNRFLERFFGRTAGTHFIDKDQTVASKKNETYFVNNKNDVKKINRYFAKK